MQININSGLNTVLQSKKKNYPQHVNRISGLDDPCLRRLYYSRHDWDKASETDNILQGVFETGNILEPVIERIVSEVGNASDPKFRIVGSQTPTNDNLLKEYQISGTIDGFLQVEIDGTWKTAGVVDIKTMSPNIYPQINDYNSLIKYPWTSKYRGQLMLYALAHNLDYCYILCVNKTNLYDMKLISFPLDMQYAENLLQKANVVNKAIKTETAPDGINDPDECPRCKFFSFCSPEFSTGGNLQISDNDELESILDRLDELKPCTDEFKELEKLRDRILTKGQDIVCGSWVVIWKQLEKNFKAQPAKEAFKRIEWRKNIIKR